MEPCAVGQSDPHAIVNYLDVFVAPCPPAICNSAKRFVWENRGGTTRGVRCGCGRRLLQVFHMISVVIRGDSGGNFTRSSALAPRAKRMVFLADLDPRAVVAEQAMTALSGFDHVNLGGKLSDGGQANFGDEPSFVVLLIGRIWVSHLKDSFCYSCSSDPVPETLRRDDVC